MSEYGNDAGHNQHSKDCACYKVGCDCVGSEDEHEQEDQDE